MATNPYHERRLARLHVAGYLLSGWFKDGSEGFRPAGRAFPADAVLVGASYDFARDQVVFVFASEEYAPVPPGADPPEVTPMYRRGHTCPATSLN